MCQSLLVEPDSLYCCKWKYFQMPAVTLTLIAKCSTSNAFKLLSYKTT